MLGKALQGTLSPTWLGHITLTNWQRASSELHLDQGEMARDSMNPKLYKPVSIKLIYIFISFYISMISIYIL